MDETGVVTPEGVLLDYRPAGLATRTMGRLIDLSLMVIMAYAAFTVGLVLLLGNSGTPFVIFVIALGFFLLFGYPVGFELYGGGRTPGHRATGTKVIRTDGGPIGFRHSAIRAMLFLVDGIATSGFAGAVSVLVTKRRQRLGDLAAGTMVIRLDRPVMPAGPPPTLGHGLKARAVEFDRRRLDAEDVATARMLMERGAQFREGAQVDLAIRVADRLDAQLGHVKLADDPPIDFIYAVLEGDGPVVAAAPVASPPTQLESSTILSGFLDPERHAPDPDEQPTAEPPAPPEAVGPADPSAPESSPAVETVADTESEADTEPEADLGFAPPT